MYLNITYDKNKKMGIIESDFFDNIREHFSIKDPAAHVKKMYSHYIPSRKYAITVAGRFECGLLGAILQYVSQLQLPINGISISDDFKKHYRPSFPVKNISLSALKLALRDYQAESVQECIKQGNGVLKLATGSGKTLLIAALIKTLHDNISNHFSVIVVPSIQLVEQTYKDFLDYGLASSDIGRVCGSMEFEIGKKIIIIGSQYLLVSKDIPQLIYDADLLVIDEVHGLKKDNKLNKVIKKFHTPHKFGLTGSLPDCDLDTWNIIGKCGPIIYEKSSAELRTQGYLSQVEVQMLKIHYKKGPTYSIPSIAEPLVAYNEEKEFLNQCSFRNLVIAKIALRTAFNTLIVVDRIIHGEMLQKIITEHAPNKSVYFIRGDVEIDDREAIREHMEKSDNLVVIAISKIFATGINIKNLHYIILAVSGKAKVRLIQSIGRGLRLHDNKEKLVIIDISDQLKYGMEHEKKRLEIYKSEQITCKVQNIYEKETT